MDKVVNYINSNKKNFVEELISFLKIPSISNNSENKQDMVTCAKWVSESMAKSGLENIQIFETRGHPVVYGDWLKAGTDKPTILVYGHYDVQPVDPLELWTSPPFEPVIKDDVIYARGTTDDKGQLFIHFKSIEAFYKN